MNWVLSISLIITPISTLAQQSFLFAFGDSYTTDGFNITAGINSTATNFVGINICYCYFYVYSIGGPDERRRQMGQTGLTF